MRELTFLIQPWPLAAPFKITGHTFTEVRVLYVSISENGVSGHGEGTGVYYLNETGESMLADAKRIKAELEAGADREELRRLLPAGGARNAIDCALWDLEAKLSGKSIWELTGITPKETITVNTVGIGTPEEMAMTASKLDTPRIKVKLDGDQVLERIQAVCAARPDAEIVVDVNQGWTFQQLREFAPKFDEIGISMIEQPLKRGGDSELENYQSPVPLCADESCLHTGELEQASRYYQMINIKLDKTGGLTEALDLAHQARTIGLDLMVGNMVGTSLAMAPGYVIAQYCRYVDLDGALFLKQDRENTMALSKGIVSPPTAELWG